MGTGSSDELRLKILLSTIEVFNTRGMRFTMDDIASNMKISKKTIYTVYRSKDEMMLDMVDFIFDNIAISKGATIENDQESLGDRIKAHLTAMPDTFEKINFTELFQLRDKYPVVYNKVKMRLESGWEPTIALLERGQEEGIIKKDANLGVFKMMMETSLSAFFESDILKKQGLTYQEGLDLVVDILLDGIKA
ncbi:transcriptional regulator, TetR family [Ruminococcaceae bacterium YRB3002]|nr:transcriptional regulator, TetR family [Ruminococcaceae bacterium YRB3002]